MQEKWFASSCNGKSHASEMPRISVTLWPPLLLCHLQSIQGCEMPLVIQTRLKCSQLPICPHLARSSTALPN
eukprot:12649434-Ditylum_brightwellii.AAC.1